MNLCSYVCFILLTIMILGCSDENNYKSNVDKSGKFLNIKTFSDFVKQMELDPGKSLLEAQYHGMNQFEVEVVFQGIVKETDLTEIVKVIVEKNNYKFQTKFSCYKIASSSLFESKFENLLRKSITDELGLELAKDENIYAVPVIDSEISNKIQNLNQKQRINFIQSAMNMRDLVYIIARVTSIKIENPVSRTVDKP